MGDRRKVQFLKNTNEALSLLIDPVRKYVLTCILCHKHIKEEAAATHICEQDKVEAAGVRFTRDASMRYCCSLCSAAVPIMLVRSHAVQHAKPEGEEWRLLSANRSRFKAKADKRVGTDMRDLAENSVITSHEAGEYAGFSEGRLMEHSVDQSAMFADETTQLICEEHLVLPNTCIASLPAAHAHFPLIKHPLTPSQAQYHSSLTLSNALTVEIPSKRQRHKVSYCLRKVRKVKYSFGTVLRAFSRAVYCKELSAFHKWRKIGRS